MRLHCLPVALLASVLTACAATPPLPGGAGVTATRGGAAHAATPRALGKLAGQVRSPIAAGGGLNLIARGGGHVLQARVGSITALGGGTIVSNHGGQLASNGGPSGGDQGGMVAAGGGNFRLAQLAPDALEEVPVAGATVFLRDALTLEVVADVPPAVTDDAGAFTFAGVPTDGAYLVEAVALGEGGDGVRLVAVARAEADDAPRSAVAVTVASTLVAARIAEATGERRNGVHTLVPGDVADAVAAIQVQLKRDRVALRQAADGLRVRSAGTAAAAVALDYAPETFAGAAAAAARLEQRAPEAQASAEKVRQAIAAGSEAADAAGAASGGGNADGSGTEGPAAGSTARGGTQGQASGGAGQAGTDGAGSAGGSAGAGGATSGGNPSGGGTSSGDTGGGITGGGDTGGGITGGGITGDGSTGGGITGGGDTSGGAGAAGSGGGSAGGAGGSGGADGGSRDGESE